MISMKVEKEQDRGIFQEDDIFKLGFKYWKVTQKRKRKGVLAVGMKLTNS